jgi:hypothetical protein
MKVTITAVDTPSELDEQVPIIVDLIRQVAGRDRPDYWLGIPRKAIVWLSRTGPREIEQVTLASRHVGRPIVSGARGLLVALGYVLDPAAIDGDRVDLRKVHYAEIASVDVD